MTECSDQLVLFHVGRREVTAAFDGGSVTSDAGVLLLSQMDRRERLTATMAEALTDRRQPGKVRHAIQELVAQRVYQIACGWEDVIDSNTLRYDPGLQTALQRVAGKPESVLASQPTLSRLEEKIRPEELEALGDWLLERKRPTNHVLSDAVVMAEAAQSGGGTWESANRRESRWPS